MNSRQTVPTPYLGGTRGRGHRPDAGVGVARHLCPSFTPSPVIKQISREADVTIYMIDDDDLPGEPGDPEHA